MMNKPPISPGSLVVNEIFHSIQGESGFAGMPCVFVRLTYCNLRCAYCDTEYAFFEGTAMTLDDIVAAAGAYGCRRVEITGGEPLFQPEVHPLMKRFCDAGYEVLLETGGSIDISNVDSRVRRIVDFKCPSSGMEKENFWMNAGLLTPRDEVKFVIGDRADFEWAKATMAEYGLAGKCPVLMSVVFGALEPVTLAGWILEDRLDVRFQLQMHKYIWHPEKRGV
jgi:7-carboxy-7-deazaguanine synthase